MGLLTGFRVVQLGHGLAAGICGRLFADAGAEIVCIDPDDSTPLAHYLNHGKSIAAGDAAAGALGAAELIVCEGRPGELRARRHDPDALRQVNPTAALVYISPYGLSGPRADDPATDLTLFYASGIARLLFAGLNRHPEVAPRVGFAWLDPMCGLMLAFVAAAGVWRRRRTGDVARVDFSMIEAMLWTMAEPLLQTQIGAPPRPHGNDSDRHAPHGVYRCAGDDNWLSLAVTDDREWRQLCAIVPALATMAGDGFRERRERRKTIDAALAGWLRPQPAKAAAATLLRAGVPAAALASATDLVASDHLSQRGFWDAHRGGVIPSLPWRASFGRVCAPAPQLGADTDAVLRGVLDLSDDDIAALRQSGALG